MSRQDYFEAYREFAQADLIKPFEVDKWRRMIPFRKFIGNLRGKALLEIGCSVGLLLRDLKPKSKVGIDISKDYLVRAGGLERCQATVESLPFKEGAFDVVVADSILEHVLSLEPVFAEMRRVLKKDGLLYACVPWKEDIARYRLIAKHGVAEHQRTFDESMESVFAKNGFSIAGVKPMIPTSITFLTVAAYGARKFQRFPGVKTSVLWMDMMNLFLGNVPREIAVKARPI